MTIALAAILSAVTTAAGAGISYSAQMSAAKQADAVAMMNMQSARQAATQNAALQAQGQQMQAAQARTEAEMQDIQANAILSRTEAEAQRGLENIRRANAASEAMQGRTRSIAGRGNVNPDTLSQLDNVILDAMQAQEYAMDQRDGINRQYQVGVLESFAPRADSVQSMLRAGFLTAAADNSIVQGGLAGRQATLDYYDEHYRNEGQKYAAMGSLLTSTGKLMGNIYQFGRDWQTTYGSSAGAVG